MKEVVESSVPAERETLMTGIELGKWVGRREAFSIIAGRCAAADVESLRRIREEKLYRRLDCTWEEYCTQHLRVARRSVDRAIGYLEEFGAHFFQVAQMAHVSANEYRSIAHHVSAQGVHFDGAVIALLPENSDRVSGAVGELLRRIEPRPRAATPPSFDSALKRCQAVAEDLQAIATVLDVRQKLELAAAVAGIRKAAASLGAAVFDRR